MVPACQLSENGVSGARLLYDWPDSVRGDENAIGLRRNLVSPDRFERCNKPEHRMARVVFASDRRYRFQRTCGKRSSATYPFKHLARFAEFTLKRTVLIKVCRVFS